MKKLILGSAILAGSMMFAQENQNLSQTPSKKDPVKFGIKGGVNSSAFDYQELSVKNQKIGFNAGAFINIPLSQKFAIQPEVLYSELGAKNNLSQINTTTIEGATVVENIDSKVYLNYISVPLMLQMKPADNFYIEAGPEFSYFLNGKVKDETIVKTTMDGNTTTTNESYSTDIDKDYVKKFNIGLGLGLGYYFTPNLGINARYVNSLTHFANNAGLEEADKNNTTNRLFQLGLNYKF
ncbi:porin family protein [Chryseobacterium terrae]|uniref:Porin family protein n=1 Tax=Chryseobacterium terrae TaxID=3163299 RepID=A0ABW8XXZ1_9FLAO